MPENDDTEVTVEEVQRGDSRLILFLVVLLVLGLAILSGSLDRLILPLIGSLIGMPGDTAIRDGRMVMVLLMFSLSFVFMVLAALEKRSSQLLLVAAAAVVFAGYLAKLADAFGEDEVLHKPLYMALVIFIAMMLPVALSNNGRRREQLLYVYGLFGVSLFISSVVGLSIIGLADLFWTQTTFAEKVGTSRFVITPMAMMICTVTWGLLAACPRACSAIPGRLYSAWQPAFLLTGSILAFLYGWIFLANKPWAQSVLVGSWTGALAAMALLLPIIFILNLLLKRQWSDRSAFSVLSLSVLCAVAQCASAFCISVLFALAASPEFPYGAETDRLAFVLTHTLTGAAIAPVVWVVLRIMNDYPWPRLQALGSVLK